MAISTDTYKTSLSDLPHEVLCQIWAWSSPTDRLVLRSTSRSLREDIQLPSAIGESDVRALLHLLNKDRYIKICEAYRACPDSAVLPCVKCTDVHPVQAFFSEQLQQPDKIRQCKAAGVVRLCPCGDTKLLREDTKVLSSHPDGMFYHVNSICCRDDSISLTCVRLSLCSQQAWLNLPPTTIWQAVKIGFGMFAAFSAWQSTSPDHMILGLTYRLVATFVQHLCRSAELEAVLRNSSLAICPHLQANSPAVVELFYRNGAQPSRRSRSSLLSNRNPWSLLSTRWGHCPHQHCHTKFRFLQWETEKHSRRPTLFVTKDLGPIGHIADLLQNESWLAQITMPWYRPEWCRQCGQSIYRLECKCNTRGHQESGLRWRTSDDGNVRCRCPQF